MNETLSAKPRNRMPVILLTLSAIVLSVIAFIPRGGSAPLSAEKTYTITASQDGLIMSLAGLPGQTVAEKGELYAFDDTEEQGALDGAHKFLQQTIDEMRRAGVAIALPNAPSQIGGTIVTTRPDSKPGNIKHIDPLPEVDGTTGGPALPSKAPAAPAGTPRGVYEAQIKDFSASIATEKSGLDNLKLELEEAERAFETSRVITERAKSDAAKAQVLLSSGAIARNDANRKDALARQQEGILENATTRRDEAKARIAETETRISGLESKLSEAQANREKAGQEPKPKPKTPAGLPPQPRVPVSPQPSRVFQARPIESTAPAKVIIDPLAKEQADARLDAAKKAIDNAEAAIVERRISTALGVKIVRWHVKVGTHVKKGDPICDVTYLPVAGPKPATQSPAATSSKS